MKKLILALLILFSFCLVTRSAIIKLQCQTINDLSQNGKELNQLARASPTDSTNYSVDIKGESNIVKINDKIVESTNDSVPKPNNISVSGEGNTVNINQTDKKSEVIVNQKGSNNHVSITQKK